jgi:hypothetical protein
MAAWAGVPASIALHTLKTLSVIQSLEDISDSSPHVRSIARLPEEFSDSTLHVPSARLSRCLLRFDCPDCWRGQPAQPDVIQRLEDFTVLLRLGWRGQHSPSHTEDHKPNVKQSLEDKRSCRAWKAKPGGQDQADVLEDKTKATSSSAWRKDHKPTSHGR